MSLSEMTAQIAVLTAISNGVKDALEAAKKGQLRDALIEHNSETNAKTFPIKLPGFDKPVGRVTLNESFGGVKVEVVNPSAYAEWLELNHPGATDWVLTVKPAFQTKHLEALVEGADTDTGKVVDLSLAKANGGVAPTVPGVRAAKHTSVPTSVSVTVGKDEQSTIFGLFRTQSVLELLPAEADRKDETPADVIEGEVVPFTAEQLKQMKRPALREECRRLELDDVGSLTLLRKRIADKQAELAGGSA